MELAVTKERLHRAECAFDARAATSESLRGQLTDTLRLLGEMKRAGFVAETFSGPRPPQVVEASEEEQQLWAAIYQRAPRGSQMASMLYQHATTMLAQDEPIEHVIGTILEGGSFDLADLEERGV